MKNKPTFKDVPNTVRKYPLIPVPSSRFTPAPQTFLVKPKAMDNAIDQKESAIFVSDPLMRMEDKMAQEDPTAIVVAVGDNCSVNVGDEVIISSQYVIDRLVFEEEGRHRAYVLVPNHALYGHIDSIKDDDCDENVKAEHTLKKLEDVKEEARAIMEKARN